MTAGRHPRHELDDVLSNGIRLSVVAALQGVQRVEFALVQESVEITSSALSKQVAILETAGYVRISKGRVGRRPRTWLTLTAAGRAALDRHLAALRAIADAPPPLPEDDGAPAGSGAAAARDRR